MKTILLGLFKRLICFPLAIIIWLIGCPFNVMFILIPQGIYWLLTGRDLVEDSLQFMNYSLSETT